MSAGKIFVGRKAELEQFKEVIKDPKGQAVLVVGQMGMGKTWLVNKMSEIAENHPELKCGWVRYEVTPTDSVDSTMALMMDNAFEAAQVTEGSFNGTSRRLEQWKSLLNVINIGDLVMSLKRDPAKNTREQFLERLRLISKQMPDNGRAIFVIDPEKYMQMDSDQSWAIVVKQLPEKIKFIFAQRPDDRLVNSEAFNIQRNVVRIPDGQLGGFTDEVYWFSVNWTNPFYG
jgi:energy-coupling factor transporter ATP-binding protein EcfA2